MSTPSEVRSFEKFNYLLRPSKQVERKLFIEALHRLGARFPIRQYKYLGLGSIYYADFILFHRHLYIDDMICVEAADIEKRMRFNCPFDFIDLRLQPVSKVIPTLDRKQRYIAWLDYDCPLSDEVLADTSGIVHVLAPGSILIVTVEADPRLPHDEAEDEQCRARHIDGRLATFREQLGRYYPGRVQRSVMSRTGLPAFFGRVLDSAIREAVARRQGLEFCQIFNLTYADGAQMMTLGGMIGDATDGARLEQTGVYDLHFVTRAKDPIRISVPPLTVREKQWLDQHLGDSLKAEDLEFELPEQMLKNFRRFYRYYPTYYEVLA